MQYLLYLVMGIQQICIPYKRLDTFDELATKNAGRVFQEMEFE